MAEERARVRIFVDFWNFQLGWNTYQSHQGASGAKVPIPWKELPAVLTAEAGRGQPTKFTGAQVYASIDPLNPKDKKLSAWLHHGLKSYTGYSVEVKERKP